MIEGEPGVIEAGVNFDELRAKSDIWICRASVFMGIGANAAIVNATIVHVLSDGAQYHFATPNPSADDSRLFIAEFEVWVEANGLRKLVEGHSNFLDAVFQQCHLITNSCSVHLGELLAMFKRFERDNITAKRTHLFELLGQKDHSEPMISSLQLARNCLAHRNGVVGFKDVNTEDGQFELRWRFSGMKLGGKFIDLNAANEDIHVEEDTLVEFGPVEKSRKFAAGAQLRITRHELAEIGFDFHIAAESILEPLMDICRKKAFYR